MMNKTLEITSLKNIQKAAAEFLETVKGHKKFAFYGPMGSGKTTFIKAISAALGSGVMVTSPTFALVNEYPLKNKEILYHFDLYRINSVEELYDIGYEEYFYSNHYIFIEWAEKAEVLLPDDICHVQINEKEDGKRLVTIKL